MISMLMKKKILLFTTIILTGCGNTWTGQQPDKNVPTDQTRALQKSDKPLTEADRLRKYQKESFEAEFRMAVYHDMND